MMASRLGYDDLVKRLCEQGADVNLTDDVRIHLQIFLKFVFLLVRHNCFDLKDEWSALINASKEGYTEIVSYLIEHEADIHHAELVCILD